MNNVLPGFARSILNFIVQLGCFVDFYSKNQKDGFQSKKEIRIGVCADQANDQF